MRVAISVAFAAAVLAGCADPPAGDEGEGEGEGEGEDCVPGVDVVAIPDTCTMQLVDGVSTCAFVLVNRGCDDALVTDADSSGATPASTIGLPFVVAANSATDSFVFHGRGQQSGEIRFESDVGDVVVPVVPLAGPAPTCTLRVATVNGRAATETIVVGDEVQLVVDFIPSTAAGTLLETRLEVLSRPPRGGVIDAQTLLFVPSTDGAYSFGVTAVEDGLGAEAWCELTVSVDPAPSVTVQFTSSGTLRSGHVAKDGAFCGVDDCRLGACAFGVYDDVSARFDDIDAGRYALAVDGAGTHTVKVFANGALAGEFSVDDAVVFADIVVDAGRVTVVDVADGPLVGECVGP